MENPAGIFETFTTVLMVGDAYVPRSARAVSPTPFVVQSKLSPATSAANFNQGVYRFPSASSPRANTEAFGPKLIAHKTTARLPSCALTPPISMDNPDRVNYQNLKFGLLFSATSDL